MKEKGFTYLEALFAIVLFSMTVIVMQETFYRVIREREENIHETDAYMLAYSLMERWKAKLVIEAGEKEIEGRRYKITIVPSSVTEMVEKCEIEVRWKSERIGERYIRFTGYRFTPLSSEPFSGITEG
jgi:Tfp pilus assembly protein PilV